jgi:hypothetical protein
MNNPWLGTRHSLPALVDIGELFVEMKKMEKKAIRLHPRRGETVPEASKMGSPILWALAEELPTCPEHNCNMIPVLQIRKDDVPDLQFPDGKDVFQIWWCPRDHPNTYSPEPRVFWLSLKELTASPLRKEFPLPPLDEFANDYIPIPCTFNPEPIIDHPHAFDVSDNHPELWAKITESKILQEIIRNHPEYEIKNVSSFYQYLLGAASGTKIGGYPNWSQTPELPRCSHGHPMDFFLQIDSAEFDGGTWGRWLTVEEKEVWGAEYAIRNAVQRAAGLMLGDMGAIFFFICRQCPDHPVRTTFQCS